MSAVPEKGHSPSPLIRSLPSLRFIMNANCPIYLHNILGLNMSPRIFQEGDIFSSTASLPYDPLNITDNKDR